VLNGLLALPEGIKQGYKDLPDLRIIICAGAPLFPETKEGIIDWLGDKLSEFYGSTEAGINLYMPQARCVGTSRPAAALPRQRAQDYRRER